MDACTKITKNYEALMGVDEDLKVMQYFEIKGFIALTRLIFKGRSKFSSVEKCNIKYQ